jgi:hypothetical protein
VSVSVSALRLYVCACGAFLFQTPRTVVSAALATHELATCVLARLSCMGAWVAILPYVARCRPTRALLAPVCRPSGIAWAAAGTRLRLKRPRNERRARRAAGSRSAPRSRSSQPQLCSTSADRRKQSTPCRVSSSGRSTPIGNGKLGQRRRPPRWSSVSPRGEGLWSSRARPCASGARSGTAHGARTGIELH